MKISELLSNAADAAGLSTEKLMAKHKSLGSTSNWARDEASMINGVCTVKDSGMVSFTDDNDKVIEYPVIQVENNGKLFKISLGKLTALLPSLGLADSIDKINVVSTLDKEKPASFNKNMYEVVISDISLVEAE